MFLYGVTIKISVYVTPHRCCRRGVLDITSLLGLESLFSMLLMCLLICYTFFSLSWHVSVTCTYFITNNQKYILLPALVCRIAVYFYELRSMSTSPQSKKKQRSYIVEQQEIFIRFNLYGRQHRNLGEKRKPDKCTIKINNRSNIPALGSCSFRALFEQC